MQTLDATTEIEAPAELVWQVIADTPRYREWNPFIRAIDGDLREGARLHVTIQAPGRMPVTFRARVMRLDPGRELRWRGQWYVPGLFDGDHALTVEPLGAGRSRFRTHENVTGLLLPILTKAMRQSQAGFEQLCEAVKARAESLAAGEAADAR
jgi:hypothetical protein